MKIGDFRKVLSSVEGYNLRGTEKFQFLEFWPFSHTGLAEAVYSTRNGGISTGPSGEMNLNLYKAFDREKGRANFELFAIWLGIDIETVMTARLIHMTDKVLPVDGSSLFNLYDEASAPKVDALITDDPRITLFLYAADCSIIYLLDTKKRAIGLIHAAWKTALKGVIGNTVEAMRREYGTNPRDLIVMIAPSLGMENFEIGEEVVSQLAENELGDFIVRRPGEKSRLDYYGMNYELLRRSGVFSENIYWTGSLSTYKNAELFHSYRRGPIETVDGAQKHLNGLNGAFFSLT